jgi:hypothetical protein
MKGLPEGERGIRQGARKGQLSGQRQRATRRWRGEASRRKGTTKHRVSKGKESGKGILDTGRGRRYQTRGEEEAARHTVSKGLSDDKWKGDIREG